MSGVLVLLMLSELHMSGDCARHNLWVRTQLRIQHPHYLLCGSDLFRRHTSQEVH